MAKQVDAFIRPVFQRPRTEIFPLVKTNIASGTQSGNTLTFDVRPPEGVTWSLDYAAMTVAAGGSTLATASISIYDGASFIVIDALAAGSFATIGTSLTVASFGNGPIILTNSKYLRFAYYDHAAGASATIHEIAMIEGR